MVNLRAANIYYNFLLIRHHKNSSIYKKLLKKKPYLAVCNIFDRNPKPSSIFALDTVFNIGFKKKNLDINLSQSLSRSQIFAYTLGNNLNYKLLFRPKLILFVLKSTLNFFVKLIYTLLDLMYIIFYSIYYINFKRDNREVLKNAINKNKKINLYTIHYWKSKKGNSIYHYYPNGKLLKKDYFYASEFPEFYSIGDGLRNTKNNILKSIDFISNKDLLISVFLLFETYLFDFFGINTSTYGINVNKFIKLTYLNRRFLYLLNYQSAKVIIKDFNFKSIYVWSENQNDTKLFSIGLTKFSPNNSKTKIISYLGCTSFSSSYHQQFIPTHYELDLGSWGQNIFMLPDQTSVDEIKLVLDKKYKGNNFIYMKIKKEMQRFKFKKIKNNSETDIKREFTFITHGTENEFLQVLKILFHTNSIIKKRLKGNPIYVRLHPSLSLKKVENFIFLLNKDQKYDLNEIIIINNQDEAFLETLNKTKFCIFGDSSLINIALSMDISVISVRTSFTFKNPIQSVYLKKKNLFFCE